MYENPFGYSKTFVIEGLFSTKYVKEEKVGRAALEDASLGKKSRQTVSMANVMLASSN